MGKYSTLSDLFKAIADAIREKGGTTDPIVAENFPDAILAIVTGPKSVNITASNISQYFTVSNSSYYFAGNGDTFTSNNGGVNSSTAKTTLTALFDMSVSFSYSYSSESGYDKFTLTFGGTTVESGASGSTTTKTYSGSITKGSTIVFQYSKDSSAHSNQDKCTFSGMTVTGYFT